MSKGQKLRALVNERLTAAAAEIFELFERTIAEYEQEVLRFKQTNDTQQQLLAAVLEPTLHSHTAAVQTVLENPEGTIKQEQNIKHEEEQLQEVSFFLPVCVKTEADEDKSSVLHQRATEENREETNGEDCGAEAGCSSDPLTQLHSDSEEHTADHSENRALHWEPQAHPSAAQKEAAGAEGQWSPFSRSERGRSRDAESSPETRAAAMNPDSSVMGGNSKPCRCSECGTAFPQRGEFFRHTLTHTGQKPYTLSVHQEGRPQADANTEERPFSCPYCHKTFLHNCSLVIHMRVHTGDKPYSCPICNKSFLTNIYLKTHLRTHTGEKPFCCPFCQRGFAQKCNLRAHVRIHTGERPYSCSVCKKTFRQKWNLKMHLRTHKTEPVPGTSGFLTSADTDF